MISALYTGGIEGSDLLLGEILWVEVIDLEKGTFTMPSGTKEFPIGNFVLIPRDLSHEDLLNAIHAISTRCDPNDLGILYANSLDSAELMKLQKGINAAVDENRKKYKQKVENELVRIQQEARQNGFAIHLSVTGFNDL